MFSQKVIESCNGVPSTGEAAEQYRFRKNRIKSAMAWGKELECKVEKKQGKRCNVYILLNTGIFI